MDGVTRSVDRIPDRRHDEMADLWVEKWECEGRRSEVLRPEKLTTCTELGRDGGTGKCSLECDMLRSTEYMLLSSVQCLEYGVLLTTYLAT